MTQPSPPNPPLNLHAAAQLKGIAHGLRNRHRRWSKIPGDVLFPGIQDDKGDMLSWRGGIEPWRSGPEVKLAAKAGEFVSLLRDGVLGIKCSFTAGSQFDLEGLRDAVLILENEECKLQHLELKNIQLGSEIVQDLCRGLQGKMSLQFLGFENSKLKPAAAKAIAGILKSPNNLIDLDVSRNPISCAGVSDIASALAGNQVLKRLNVSYCEIGGDGGKSLANMLSANIVLEQLNLSGNSLEKVGGEIADALVLSPIQAIEVVDCGLSLGQLLSIEAALSLPSEVWKDAKLDVALTSTRELNAKFSSDVWEKTAVKGDAIRTYFEEISHFWHERVNATRDAHHLPTRFDKSSQDLLSSLQAAVVVVDAERVGPRFHKDRLERLAYVYVPQDPQLECESMHISDLLILNLTPFDSAFDSGRRLVRSRTADAIPRRPIVPVAPLPSSIGSKDHVVYPWSPPALPLQELFSGRSIESEAHAAQAPHRRQPSKQFVKRGSKTLCLNIDVELHVNAKKERVRICQDVGEKRYALADGYGELRSMFSITTCRGLQAHLLTFVWSPPSRLRGVTLQDINRYWQRQWDSLGRHGKIRFEANQPDMYEVVDRAIIPSTTASQSSLAELLNFGPVDTFVSHYWGSKTEGLLAALRKQSNTCPKKDETRYWICSIAINQRIIADELGNDIDSSSFAKALHSESCSAMALMLDDGCQTLKRIWCLYEIMSVILLRRRKNMSLDLCTAQGVLNQGENAELTIHIAKEVALIDIAYAECSNLNDKALIDEAINTRLGGHEKMNKEVREAVDECLKKTQRVFERRINEVSSSLSEKKHLSSEELLKENDRLKEENERLKMENERLREENDRLKEERPTKGKRTTEGGDDGIVSQRKLPPMTMRRSDSPRAGGTRASSPSSPGSAYSAKASAKSRGRSWKS